MLNNRGQIRIIEAFLAISVVFSALVITAPMSSTPDLEKQDRLKQLGRQVLTQLDANATLGRLIEDGNWTELRQLLDLALPKGIAYNLTIYDENMQHVNPQDISNSNLQSREAVVVEHLCVVQNPLVSFYIIRLTLAWPG